MARAVALGLCLVGTPGPTSRATDTRADPRDRSTTSAGADAPTRTWRRIERPRAAGGGATPAFLHVADVDRSDPRLAGLMLRCGGTKVEAVLVVVAPFQPGERPKITLRANGEEAYFDAEVIQAGTGLRFPLDQLTSMDGPRHAADELTVQIVGADASFGGVIPLIGLGSVVTSLTVDCAQDHE